MHAQPRREQRKGSLLIVAMILSAIIAVSLTSYLNLGRTGLEISNRAFYNNGAMNLAENGLEQAVYALNTTATGGTYNWGNWHTSGSNAYREWTDSGTFGAGAAGGVRAYIYNYT